MSALRERIIAAVAAVDASHDFGSGDLPSVEEYADAVLTALDLDQVRMDTETEADRQWAELGWPARGPFLETFMLGADAALANTKRSNDA